MADGDCRAYVIQDTSENDWRCAQSIGILGIDSCIPMATDSPSSRQFAVSFSFPGEYRDYVEQVATALLPAFGGGDAGKARVFYDAWHEGKVIGYGSNRKLQKIYAKDSDLIVPFYCENYLKKHWCGVELRAIEEILFNKEYDRVLPFRFDLVEIPSSFKTDLFPVVTKRRPKDIADLIIERYRDLHQTTMESASRAERQPSESVQHIFASGADVPQTRPPGGGTPTLLARFQEENGELCTVETEDEELVPYWMDLWIQGAPPETQSVAFEIPDRGFSGRKWTVSRAKRTIRPFLTDDMNSYGDVDILVQGTGPGVEWTLETTLYKALEQHYRGRKKTPDIRRALKQIRHA